MDLDNMEYQDYFNSYIEIKGYTAHVYWHQKFNQMLGVDLGAGVFAWNADAILLSQKVGSDSDTSAYFDARLLTEFNEKVSAFAAARYLPDVTGTDIFTLSIGMTVGF